MAVQVLTKRQAAKVACISPRYLSAQIKAGTGPAVTKIGNKECVMADELEAWLRHCTVAPAWFMASLPSPVATGAH